MNRIHWVSFYLAVLCFGWRFPAKVLGQSFSSGSDGSYGAINVTADMVLDAPPDGVFRCTTVNVATSRTLRFRRNANNTPIYLLATGDVVIAGTIGIEGSGGNNVVGGEGGPGGFNGGNPASVSVPPGAGYGPGAGQPGAATTTPDGAGAASYASVGTSGSSTNKGQTYGSALLVPMAGGSGGGGTQGNPGTGGGGGGGALLIASNTRIDVSGTIRADGGRGANGVSNGGSGGAVRLVAPSVTGGGTVSVVGSFGGGPGRVRIDTINRTSLNINFQPAGVTSVGSMLLVFPTPTPRLDIVEAAGTAISIGSGPVLLQLPFGSSPNRVIKVRAQDFGEVVPIRVRLTPDNGLPLTYDAEVDNRSANPGEVSVSVTLPVNVQTLVQAWTR